jgi:hypothetical protein
MLIDAVSLASQAFRDKKTEAETRTELRAGFGKWIPFGP